MVAMRQKEDQKLLQCSQLGHQGHFRHVGISVQWQSSACNRGSVVRTIVGLSCQWQSDWATLEQGRHSVVTVMWLPAWTIQWTSVKLWKSAFVYLVETNYEQSISQLQSSVRCIDTLWRLMIAGI